MKNIVLIGMPGAGKSTVGVLLAKILGKKFVDTDLLIQEATGRLLQEIIDTEGTDAFLSVEEETILSTAFHNTVVATGGSIVFSRRAMQYLKSGGIAVYLEISSDEMVRRLLNITTRGIVLFPGQILAEMYAQRLPLYQRYADITINCTNEDFEIIVGMIVHELKKIPV